MGDAELLNMCYNLFVEALLYEKPGVQQEQLQSSNKFSHF
jgi:hypothetical protein